MSHSGLENLPGTEFPLLPPVITIDGPGGTGKGTVSQRVAKALNWHYLDSGSLFRIIAYMAVKHGIALNNEDALQTLAATLLIQHRVIDNQCQIIAADLNITTAIRTEACGNAASIIAVLPKLRYQLLIRQRAFRQPPGLVTDGRDMGTVIFPDAPLKFFLQATPSERARRRYLQLKKQGLHVTLEEILQDLAQRDARDKDRGVAPLKAAPDAIVIDTTSLSVIQVFEQVMMQVKTLSNVFDV